VTRRKAAQRREVCDGTPLAVDHVRLRGGQVLLIGAQSLLDVQRALEATLRQGVRDGYPQPPRVLGLVRVIKEALAEHSEHRAQEAGTSDPGNAEVPPKPNLPTSVTSTEPVSTREAAVMLGISERQMRNLATSLGGRRVGGSWSFDREVLVDEATRRNQEGIAQ
jgi:hypothetical protein